ncbi:LOW QUALITY PROTEIN: histone H1.8-like [Tamandua tetradactyla]|uniref:LOW QUALITY PROTEIN: histone H1.8-like n=1 Tax=Tamandua tetradactyla TaxID=48850 RepID=UPI00405443BB
MSLTEAEKPGPSYRGLCCHPPPHPHPLLLHRVLEVLEAREWCQGTLVFIKLFILQKYPMVDLIQLKYLLKQTLTKEIHRSLLVRPLNSKAKDTTGSFKLVPQRKRKTQLQKTSAIMALSKPRGKGPKKPSEAKKEPPNPGQVEKVPKKPGEVEKVPPKPGPAKEKILQKGNKDKMAKLGEAKKVSPKLDKAVKAAPGSAAGLSGKAEAKGNSQDAEVHSKTKAGNRSSNASATKGKNDTIVPGQKKMVAMAKIPKEAAAPGPREEPKTKAASPPKGKGGNRPKTGPACLGSKMEVPKGPGRLGLPTKSLSSKGPSKKSKAGI